MIEKIENGERGKEQRKTKGRYVRILLKRKWNKQYKGEW